MQNINPALFGKPLVLVSAPVTTRSGYGDSARDFVHHLLSLGKYDVKIWPTNWGQTPTNALRTNNEKDKKILQCILTNPNLGRQPDVFVSITVPNEFQPIGKFNIGYTAGIETTIAASGWIEGINRMDLTLVTSQHSKNVLESTKYTINNQSGHPQGELKTTKPIEVFHNSIDPEVFKKIDEATLPNTIKDLFSGIPETFGFLFVGHWLQGEMGQDRKDVGMLVKVFLETFKNETKPPALILKTSSATFSILDREETLRKMSSIKQSVQPVPGKSLPNVYLIHGDLTPEEMNGLFNHPKAKAHISLTKGEGFGMPLLQATLSMKPVIASGWSGQLDFLNSDDAILIGGKLENVHDSAIWPGVIEKGSQWFTADYNMAATAMQAVFKDYQKFIPGAKKLMRANREKFGYPALQKQLVDIFEKYVPAIPVELPLTLPSLRKIT